MKSVGLRSVVIKKFRPQKSSSVYAGGENLLKQDFTATNINQKWVSDITYIHTLKDGWCYLASVMDLATNKIIGWHFSRHMDTELVLTALNNAVKSQKYLPPELILHSDRGSQYTSHTYQNAVKALHIRQSFSAKGCPYDNAPIESFHAVLKKELVHRRIFKDFEHAKLELFQYIEGRYNRHRIHSALNYLTPQQMEEKLTSAA
jgi:transposase InsO family protein